MKNMTVDEIKERSAYQDGGNKKYEVIEWIEAIQKHL